MIHRWRALIVDDEPLVRGRIRSLLQSAGDFEIAGECGDGRGALEAIEGDRVDLVLLDIQMPELDGFAALELVDPRRRPVVIFVTAYDEYALRAFEAHDIDYLLKPFDRHRFEQALDRARRVLSAEDRHQQDSQLKALLDGYHARKRYVTRFPVKQNGRILFLKAEEIDYVEAAGKYVCLHVRGESHVLRDKLSGVEARLDPERFVRIHRSTIVNVERIQELRPCFHGDYQVLLHDGTELMLSRGRREQLEKVLGPLP
ncbi:MAG: response regulator transcription factor [Bryobacterales bacterium]|nr:response regulator transcription factor [Bryobacterales bacterium]